MAPGKAYTDHQFHSNSYTGPRPTPTIPKGGLFSLYASTQIPTPPIHPYTALLELPLAFQTYMAESHHTCRSRALLATERKGYHTWMVNQIDCFADVDEYPHGHFFEIGRRHVFDDEHKPASQLVRVSSAVVAF